MPATAATMRRGPSRFIPPARSAASPPRSSAPSSAAPPSNPSSATSRNIIAWAATSSPTAPEMPPTPSSPPSATTSDGSSPGSVFSCAYSWNASAQPRSFSPPEIRIVHGRQEGHGPGGQRFWFDPRAGEFWFENNSAFDGARSRRFFFHLPFEHSEDAADQDRSIVLFRAWARSEPA